MYMYVCMYANVCMYAPVHYLYSRYRGASLFPWHQLYADDVQAYTHCPPDCAVTMVRQLCLAMDSLSGCLDPNRLLLNPTKTQFIWLGSRRRMLTNAWSLKPFLTLSSVIMSVT